MLTRTTTDICSGFFFKFSDVGTEKNQKQVSEPVPTQRGRSISIKLPEFSTVPSLANESTRLTTRGAAPPARYEDDDDGDNDPKVAGQSVDDDDDVQTRSISSVLL